MEEGVSRIDTKWWRGIKTAYEDLEKASLGFASKKKLTARYIKTDHLRFMTLRLLNGWSRGMTSGLLSCDIEDLEAWEEGRDRIPRTEARQIVQHSDFALIRKRTPGTAITTFFDECSVSDMIRDYNVRHYLLKGIYGCLLAFALVMPLAFFPDVIGLVILQVYMLVVFTVVMGLVSASVLLRKKYPILSNLPQLEFAYGRRFVQHHERESMSRVKELLSFAASGVERELPRIAGLKDLKVSHQRLINLLRKRMIPRLSTNDDLGPDEVSALESEMGALSEYFEASNSEYVPKLNRALSTLQEAFPEVVAARVERPLVGRVSKWTAEAPRSRTGRRLNEAVRVIDMVAFGTLAVWLITRAPIEILGVVFLGLCGIFAAIWGKIE